MICPSCRQDVAPIVRGVRAYCTACGAPMSIVSAPEAVNVAGQPAKVGGGIVKALGWLAVAGGLVVALLFALLAFAVGSVVPLYFGGFFAAVAAIFAIPLLIAGRSLRRAGDAKEHAARERAVFALAAQRRGMLSVATVARALEMAEADADALLTELAKRPDGRVGLEVDDNGNLTYVFRDLVAAGAPAQKVRIDGGGWRVPSEAQAPGQPRVVDAELVEEEAAAAEEPARRMTR